MDLYHRHNRQATLYMLILSMVAVHNWAHAASQYELAPSPQYKIGRLGFQPKWQAHWFQSQESYLSGYADTSLLRDFSTGALHYSGYANTSRDLGLAAVLRYQRSDGTGFYAEAGAGPQYRSISYDLAGRQLGPRLSLNTLAGIGFVWKNGVDLGFKAVHLTRGQGPEGNDAVSMVGVGLQYRW